MRRLSLKSNLDNLFLLHVKGNIHKKSSIRFQMSELEHTRNQLAAINHRQIEERFNRGSNFRQSVVRCYLPHWPSLIRALMAEPGDDMNVNVWNYLIGRFSVILTNIESISSYSQDNRFGNNRNQRIQFSNFPYRHHKQVIIMFLWNYQGVSSTYRVFIH